MIVGVAESGSERIEVRTTSSMEALSRQAAISSNKRHHQVPDRRRAQRRRGRLGWPAAVSVRSRESKMAQPKVLAFINYKGGVAKTTSAYHVGCWLAGMKGKRVLLIDIDPQTNLTFLCAPVSDWERRKRKVGTIASMYRRYVDGKPIDTKRYLWQTPIRLRDSRRHPRLDLIPCDIDLIGEDIGTTSRVFQASSPIVVRHRSHRRRHWDRGGGGRVSQYGNAEGAGTTVHARPEILV